MPTYNYRCEECGVLEIVQPITEPALETCPHCQGAIKRVIGKNVLVLFKGSGFYATDSKGTLGATIGTPDASSDSESSSSVETKAVDKPEKKTEEKAAEPTAKSSDAASQAAN